MNKFNADRGNKSFCLSFCEEFYAGSWSNSCIDRFQEKFKNSGAEKLLIFLNVGRHYYEPLGVFKTFIGQGVDENDEELRACHYAVAIVDFECQNITYCDSKGWGMPDNFNVNLTSLLGQLGFTFPFNYVQCHMDKNSQEHFCVKGKCSKYYSLQICKHVVMFVE